MIFLIVAFAAVGVFAAFKIYSAKRENERLAAEKEAQAYPYKTVEYNGKTYDYNEGVYNLLVLGIDAEGEYEEGEFFETGGKADAIFILSINNSKKTVSTIQLNRDTVTKFKNSAYSATRSQRLMLSLPRLMLTAAAAKAVAKI